MPTAFSFRFDSNSTVLGGSRISRIQVSVLVSPIGRTPFLRQHRTKTALRALHASCLHIFRHIAQVLLGGRQPAGVELVQSDEKPDGAICAQALCGVALILPTLRRTLSFPFCSSKSSHRSPHISPRRSPVVSSV